MENERNLKKIINDFVTNRGTDDIDSKSYNVALLELLDNIEEEITIKDIYRKEIKCMYYDNYEDYKEVEPEIIEKIAEELAGVMWDSDYLSRNLNEEIIRLLDMEKKLDKEA